MFNKFLRENKIAAGILTLLRLYLGYGFLMAGWEKLTGPKPFDATGFLMGVTHNPVLSPAKAVEYPTYLAFLKGFALPNAHLFNTIVPLGEFLVGLGLILGCLTTAAALFGLIMNFSYVMAGVVSSNPLDILLGVIILAAGYNAGRIGLDRWVLPIIRKYIAKGRNTAETIKS
jgi:thiosulfate dehydrogenase [quinone] large subunit